VSRHFTTDDGLNIAYEDTGAGLPLLCLAGLTRNMADFEPVARDFAHRARVIRMDYRGRGQSDHDPDYMNYSIARESTDALQLLDHLGIRRAAILGTSRGGLIAMALAPTCRDRLLGVCLNDIGPEIAQEGIAYIMTYLGQCPAWTTYDAGATGLMETNARSFPGVPQAYWRRHAERIWRQEDDGLYLRYDARLRQAILEQSATGEIPDLWPLFDALDGVPLGLIHGVNSDLLTAGTVARMRARRPDMLYAAVPDRGHVPFLDEPQAQQVLSEFLDRVAAGLATGGAATEASAGAGSLR